MKKKPPKNFAFYKTIKYQNSFKVDFKEKRKNRALDFRTKHENVTFS